MTIIVCTSELFPLWKSEQQAVWHWSGVQSSLAWVLSEALVDWSGLVHSWKMIEEFFFGSAGIAYLSYCWLFASAVIKEGGKRKCELVFAFMIKLMLELGES